MKIFISYRRGTSTDIVGRIQDRLAQHFGRDEIFYDLVHIPPGQHFPQRIAAALSQAAVLLVVIGPDWLTGGSLANPDDWVRWEIETALGRRDLRMIPLLVGGAELPSASELPPNLQPLLRYNGMRIDSGTDFYHHLQRLIHVLDPSVNPRASFEPATVSRPPSLRAAAVLGSVLALGTVAVGTGAALFLYSRVTEPSASAPSASATAPLAPGAVSDAGAVDVAPPSAPSAAASSSPVAVPTDRAPAVSSSQPPARTVRPSQAELRQRLLDCWKQTEGADAETAASSLIAAITWTSNSQNPIVVLLGPAPDQHPRFRACAEHVLAGIRQRLPFGQDIDRFDLLLPGKQTSPAFPSEAQVRAAMLACWTKNEGSVPGTPAITVNVKVERNSRTFANNKTPRFEACGQALLDDLKKRASVADRLSFKQTLPAGPSLAVPPASPPASSATP